MRKKIDALGNETNLPETMEEFKKKLEEPQVNKKELLRECYFDTLKVLEYYMDDTPENLMFYSVWVIGSYFHKEFYSYPYLFLNAMRGSGKSRLLKLLAFIGNGKYTSSITEPIIFRTQGLLCIDEMEGIGGKDKSNLRELLNASYKKGMTIMRTIKKKNITGDNMVIEEFEPYRPIAIANIWGMEEVLGDRCITRILEKSNNPIKTKRIEDFEGNSFLKILKVKLMECSVCDVVLKKKQALWNKYIDHIHLYTTYTTYTNYTNYTFSEEELAFYKKIDDSNITGRNLELLLPIFIVADYIGSDVFDIILDIGKKMNEEKKETEIQESTDVMVYNFISEQCSTQLEYIPIKELFYRFKQYSGLEGDWVNDRWFGKSLKRLNLIIHKRRVSSGIEVILNVAKAKEKIKIFKTEK